MNSRKGYRKLGKDSAHRKAMLRNLTTEVIVNERIQTTEAKAKELRRTVDKMITLGKRGDLHARRQVAAYMYKVDAGNNQDAIQKLFEDVAPRFKNRQGGYTRIIKKGTRAGDNAEIVIIELVEADADIEKNKVDA